jgi:hypothetical protein
MFITLTKEIAQWNYTQFFVQTVLGLVQRVKSPEDPGDEEPESHELFLNEGFYIPVDRWRYTVEFNWKSNKWNHGGEDEEIFLTPRLMVSLLEIWEFGLSAPIGLDQDSENFRTIGQFNFEFDT